MSDQLALNLDQVDVPDTVREAPDTASDDATICAINCVNRRTQLTELPGTTFEDIFAGPPSRIRTAA